METDFLDIFDGKDKYVDWDAVAEMTEEASKIIAEQLSKHPIIEPAAV